VNLAVALTTATGTFRPVSLVIALSIAVGSTIQVLALAGALRRYVGVAQLFETGPATLAFTGVSAACCLVASTWGVATLSVFGAVRPEQFLDSWQTWWLGDLIGVLVFAPAFLTWRQSLQVGRKPWRLARFPPRSRCSRSRRPSSSPRPPATAARSRLPSCRCPAWSGSLSGSGRAASRSGCA
jgi:integral membrane sensor domain MASE1